MTQGGSILAADFGSVYTRVMLIDVVDGIYRVVARSRVRSTGGFPAGDVTVGLAQAVKTIEEVTGRKLLDKERQVITPEEANRQGVDVFVATASGGRSLRSVIVGLMPDVSIASAQRATEGTYVNVVDVISLYDPRTEEDQLNALIVTQPDLVLVTGGIDGGATEPVRKVLGLVKMALESVKAPDRPVLLYAGNNLLAGEVRDQFSELTRVLVADNVRPTLYDEDLDSAQLQLGQAFDEYKESQGSGFEKVGEMSRMGLLPTAQSYSVLAEYLGRAANGSQTIATLDIGSASSALATYQDGKLKTTIRTDIGVGHSAANLAQNTPIDRIRRWIPFAVARADVLNYALNKQARPASVPASSDDLFLEYALARVAGETLVYSQHPAWERETPTVDRVIVGGSSLAATGNPGLTAMLVLDILQPGGMTDIYADTIGLIPALGPLAYTMPEAVVHLVNGHNLEHIATVFSVEGVTNLRRAAMHYEIKFDDGEVLDETLNGGELLRINLPPGKTARVKVSVARGSGLTIGGKRAMTQNVVGGLAGIILDTRGRPLPLAVEIEKRAIQIILWQAMASGVEPQDIDESRLEPVPERDDPGSIAVAVAAAHEADDAPAAADDVTMLDFDLDAEPEKSARRGLFGRRTRKAEPESAPAAAPASKKPTRDDEMDELDALFGDEDF